MEYSYIQKMAILRLLLDIIGIDGKIDERESLYFEKVKKELQLSPEDHFKVKEFNTLLSLSVLKEMSDEQKQYYAYFMRNMILIDGIIEPSELIAYEDICSFCDIPLTDISLTDNQ